MTKTEDRQIRSQKTLSLRTLELHSRLKELMADAERLSTSSEDHFPNTSSDLGWAVGKMAEALEAIETRTILPLG